MTEHSVHEGATSVETAERVKRIRMGLPGQMRDERLEAAPILRPTPHPAIGEPGLIEVFDTGTLRRHETVSTESGAHTLAFEAASNTVYAFLPEAHRAAVYLGVE
jgi:hypothetical protein